ncbi:MAG TPA: ABC transporter permease [Acidimicrobiales bacterium]
MASPAPVRYLEHELVVYRRLWRSSLASSFLAPVLFLAAIGGTLGSSIDHHGAARLGGVGYLAWLAPGLLAANAMQVAIQECFHPVLGGFKWTRHFIAAAATPLRPVDIVEGWLAWVMLRAALVSAVYVAVAGVFGALRSPWVVAAVPVAALTGLAFAAPATAWSATRERDESFSALQRFVVLPLFLFSGAFFPIGQLPAAVRPLAYVLPLWHGVVLCRALALGNAGLWATLGHLAVLGAYIVIGAVAAVWAFQRRLAA